jgi:putative endonuclease
MRINSHNKNLGKIGENHACEYLSGEGYTVVARNFRTKFGEIDIVAVKNQVLYCIEVKTRTNTNFGQPYEAINNQKLGRMILSAQIFSQINKIRGEMKLVLVEVVGKNIKLTELE